MKRAELRRGKPLKRGRGPKADQAKIRAWDRRSRRPLPATGAKHEREVEAWGLCRQAVIDRDRCCRICSGPGNHVHHRWPSDRRAGVHDPARCLLLCSTCHDWVHLIATTIMVEVDGIEVTRARFDGLLMRDGDEDPWA